MGVRYMKRLLRLGVVAMGAAVVLLPAVAHAGLIYSPDQNVDLSGTGFGSAPRILTLQATGNATTETGAIAPVGGIPTASVGVSNGQVFGGNGIQNNPTGSSADMPPPIGDTQKYGVPSITSL